jgi:hypothetical protein
MVGLVRTLLVFFVVYYLFKFTAKYLLPFFVSNRINKIKREQDQAQSNWVKQKKAEEGKVTIKYTSKGGNKTATDGEYVDYEEV